MAPLHFREISSVSEEVIIFKKLTTDTVGHKEHLLLLLCLLVFSFVTGLDYCVNPAHGSPPPQLIG